MKRTAMLLAWVLACALGAGAETGLELQAYYGFPNHGAVDASGFVPVEYGVLKAPNERDVGSSWGGAGAKAILSEKLVFPALAGRGELTRDNNLALDLSGELSPVSVNANVEASLTPIAFLTFSAGAGGGTGWDIGFTGLGIVDANSGEVEIRNFGGLVYRAWVKGTFQFDLAAVLPGDWNHLVALASPKVEYQAYTGAGKDTSWIWEADDAMNFNGLKLKGSYFLGYQMPIALDMAGFLLETEGWLGALRERSPSTKAGGWGSDYTYLNFGPVFDFRIDGRSSLAFLVQCKTGIKWTDATTRAPYFESRDYEGSYLYFNRAVFDYTLKL